MAGLLDYAMPIMGEEGGGHGGQSMAYPSSYPETKLGKQVLNNPDAWNFGNWMSQTQWGMPGGSEYQGVMGRLKHSQGYTDEELDQLMSMYEGGQNIANMTESALLGPNQSFEGYGAIPGSEMINTGETPFNITDIVEEINRTNQQAEDFGYDYNPSGHVAGRFLNQFPAVNPWGDYITGTGMNNPYLGPGYTK